MAPVKTQSEQKPKRVTKTSPTETSDSVEPQMEKVKKETKRASTSKKVKVDVPVVIQEEKVEIVEEVAEPVVKAKRQSKKPKKVVVEEEPDVEVVTEEEVVESKPKKASRAKKVKVVESETEEVKEEPKLKLKRKPKATSEAVEKTTTSTTTTSASESEEPKKRKYKKASTSSKSSTSESELESKSEPKQKPKIVSIKKTKDETEGKISHYYKIVPFEGYTISDESGKYGRFEGSKPRQAGNKAYSTICRNQVKYGLDFDTNGLVFSIVESTRGDQTVEYSDGTSKQVPICKKTTIKVLEDDNVVEKKVNKVYTYVGSKKLRQKPTVNIIEVSSLEKEESRMEMIGKLRTFLSSTGRLPTIEKPLPRTKEQQEEIREKKKAMSKEELEAFSKEAKLVRTALSFERKLVKWIRLQNLYFTKQDNVMQKQEVYDSWRELLSTYPGLDLIKLDCQPVYSYVEMKAVATKTYAKLPGKETEISYTRSAAKAEKLGKQEKTYTKGKVSHVDDYDLIYLEDGTELKRYSYDLSRKLTYGTLKRDEIDIKYRRTPKKALKFGKEEREFTKAKVLEYKENKFGDDEPHLLLLEDNSEVKRLVYYFANDVKKWKQPEADVEAEKEEKS